MSIPITVLCGFLGSGKTTLLRSWKREPALKDAAIIVHDLSEFGVDAELVAEEGSIPLPGQMCGRVAALHGRHAGELLHESLGATLKGICRLDPPPPVVIVESTGAARPWPLLRALMPDENFTLRHFIVTVDGLNLHRDFANGLGLLDSQMVDPALQTVAGVMLEQLLFASVVILTKLDTVPQRDIEPMVQWLQQLNPAAAVALSAQAGVKFQQLDTVLPLRPDDLWKKAQQFTLHGDGPSTAAGIESILFRDPRPFHPQRLWECCQKHLETGLFRTKGFLWLISRSGHVLLWQQAGSQISLELTGLWRAELARNREGKLLPEEVDHLNRCLEGAHPIFGDRQTELTLIGLRPACESFADALRGCLCSEEEIAAWLDGGNFLDPWPNSIKRSET
jgi:G3E family GTPase